MSDIDLSSLSVSDLNDLIKRAHDEIGRKEAQRLEEARDRISQIANEYGLPLEDLLKAQPRVRASRGKAAPKYRNPNDPSQTWAGRGRKPSWLEAELKQGANLEDFAI